MDTDLFMLYNAMKGKSQEERMRALTSMTQEQQQSGELNDTKMEEIYRMLAPMLTEPQRQKMCEVIRRLKT